MSAPATDQPAPSDFIRDIVAEDVRGGKHTQIHTRFPPEPNGYLHIGHAKASASTSASPASSAASATCAWTTPTRPRKTSSTWIPFSRLNGSSTAGHDNLGLSQRQDAGDTDGRQAESRASASRDRIRNLRSPFYASDYFDQIYEYASQLIRKGKAYVCDLTPEDTDEYRRLGKESPFRNRSVEENLDLFTRMKAGEFPDGTRTLAREDRHAARRTSGCAIRSSTASATPSIITPATNGAFTRCTISPIA